MHAKHCRIISDITYDKILYYQMMLIEQLPLQPMLNISSSPQLHPAVPTHSKVYSEADHHTTFCPDSTTAYHAQAAPQELTQSVKEESTADLARRYGSVYNELTQLNHSQLLSLLLEEMDEHEICRERLHSSESDLQHLSNEVAGLKDQLRSKRQAIARLCQTQTNNLNLIEELEQQVGKRPPVHEAHYLRKYKQLQEAMNEYLSSNSDAEQEYKRTCQLLQHRNKTLSNENKQLTRQVSECHRVIKLKTMRCEKAEKSVELWRDKIDNMRLTLLNQKEQGESLKSEVKEIHQKLTVKEDQGERLARENRQMSYELDIIRQKVNENETISRDLLQRMEDETEQASKIAQQLQAVRNERDQAVNESHALLGQLEQERKQWTGQREHLTQSILTMQTEQSRINDTMCQLAHEKETICEAKQRQEEELRQQLQERQESVRKLQGQLTRLKEEEEQLTTKYEEERSGKQSIRSQLVELAQQVALMQHTYRRQLTQNEQIKNELQRFWQRKQEHMHHSTERQSIEKRSLWFGSSIEAT